MGDQGPSLAHTASLVAKTGWRPTEGVVRDTQGREGTSLWTASLRLRTMEKGLGEIFGEIAQDHQVCDASVRSVVNSIGDAARVNAASSTSWQC